MPQNKLEFKTNVKKSPADVIDFVSDVRNRGNYQSSLTSTDIEGEAGVGQTWKWRYELMGRNLEGTGKGVELEAGKLYAFVTEGAVTSHFSYRAESAGDETTLTVEVEFDLPPELEQLAGKEQLLQAAQQTGNNALAQLKQTLEQ